MSMRRTASRSPEFVEGGSTQSANSATRLFEQLYRIYWLSQQAKLISSLANSQERFQSSLLRIKHQCVSVRE
eukprot:3133382-Amphidinium_carterae.1